ncbi:MAG: alpha/beta fold hydrolase [Eubacteriales bacterium]|nr:alpha/beta fold hydrolase [Eubacteriales bacterium]
MLHEVSFPSFNERDTVQGWIYVPAAEPVGIVQLVHGFGEHSRRYLHMISAFVDAGYIVAADDHVGHGKTAMVNNVWSDWGAKGPHTQMEDEHTLTTITKEKYPDLPYFLFGHSMGSFIVRDYIAKYGDEVDGVTICGTAGRFRGSAEAAAACEKAIAEGRGEEVDTDILGIFMGWMCERCDEPIQYGNEWICHDLQVQYDHANDPFNAFTKPATIRTLYDFAQMMKQIEGTEWAEKVPKDLPIYNIAGDEDPVGNYGEGVYMVSNWLIQTGHQVITEVYSGYRHEIHNYEEIKEDVEEGIIEFMDDLVFEEE